MPINIEDNEYDLEKISLGIPNQLQNNVYFSKLYLDNEGLLIQTNQCFTSTGILSTNHKYFCDLVYENFYSVTTFFEKIEDKIKNLLIENKEDWFEDDLTLSDIEEAFSSPVIFHKKGVKLRVYLHRDNITDNIILNCYNSLHEKIDNNKLVAGIGLIPIFEVVGLKFSNKSFNLELKLVQVLMPELDVNQYNIHESLFTKKEIKNENNDNYKQLMIVDNEECVENKGLSNKEAEKGRENSSDEEDEYEDEDREEEEIEIINDDGTGMENNSIKEFELNYNDLESEPYIKLKSHADIYEEIWKLYCDEAYKVRQQNVEVYLKSKNVHVNYMINEI